MLYIFSASVKAGKLHEFRDWLKSNESRIKSTWPKSWSLAGLYFSVYGFGGHLFEVHWNLSDGYASFDVLSKSTDSSVAALQLEWFEYLDLSDCNARLLKPATSPETICRAK